jgi:hypothetical protein
MDHSRIGTRFLRPRGTSPLKGVNPAGTPGNRNGTESFFGLKGRPSVVRDVGSCINERNIKKIKTIHLEHVI